MRRLWVRLATAALLVGASSTAPAQTIESVLRPGDVSAGHAMWEED